MAYEIFCKDWPEARRVARHLGERLAVSRFTLAGRSGRIAGGIHFDERKRHIVVKIACVRLREKRLRGYAGPGPDPRIQKRRLSSCLAGADWIGFNNMVNDVLDKSGHKGNAGSSVVTIRVRGARRVRYWHEQVRYGAYCFRRWDKRGHWTDYRKCCRGCPPPPTIFPDDTPGLAQWRLRAKKKAKPAPVEMLAGRQRRRVICLDV